MDFIYPFLRLRQALGIPGVFTMGVNAAGMEFAHNVLPGVAGTDFALIASTELDYYKERGLTNIRLPFLWERVQPTVNGELDATHLGYIQAVVTAAASRGMKVLLDVHNYGGRSPEGKLGNGTLTSAHFADLWTRLATVFVGQSGIQGYDIMNEPSGMPNDSAWPNAAQAAVNAIRAVDTATTIYIEGNHYASAGQWRQYNDNLRIIDPSNNLIYSAHCYLDRDNSGSHFVWDEEAALGITTNIGVERLSVFFGWLQQHGFRGHIGEMGTGNDNPNWLMALDNALTYAQTKKLQFTYWAAGPRWGDGYGYSVEPSDVDGRDKVQMAVLTKYSGGTPPQKIYVSGPERGVAGSASAPFAFDYRGLLTTPLVVTPSDNGAGGTFTPPSLTFQPGFNGFGTSTYQASGTDTYQISASNNRGFDNPKNLGYATALDLFKNASKTPVNVFGLRRIYSPYIGPLLRLKRDSDSAESDFGFTTDGRLDRAAIQQWASGPNSTTRVIKWYDQLPTARHITTVYSDNTGGASGPRDYPIFVLDNGDGFPAVKWLNSVRADMPSPLTGITEQTIITHLLHKSGDRFLSAQFSAYDNWPNGTGWGISSEPDLSIPMGLVADEWHTYSGTWQANTTNGWKTYRDNVLIAEQDAKAIDFTLDFNRNTFNMGYFRFYQPLHYTGDAREIVIFSGALTPLEISAFQADIAAYYSTPLAALPAYSDVAAVDSGGPALPVKYKGVNISGAESSKLFPVPFYDYVYPTRALIDYYSACGMTTVRMPFNANTLQPRRNQPFNAGELARIDEVVQYCRSKGMWLILDPHNYGRLNNSAGVARVINVDADMPISMFADFWMRLATIYKNQLNVMFNLMNEPYSQTAVQWQQAAAAAVTAIRSVGATQKILIPGTSYTGAHSWISSGNAAAWAGFSDANFAYEMHQYLDSNNSGTSAVCTLNSGSTRLAAATNWARAQGAKAFLGEIGWSQDPSCPAEGEAIMSYMSANSDVWVGWTYWTSGPYYPQSYIYSIDPASLSAPVDKPQMAVLKANL